MWYITAKTSALAEAREIRMEKSPMNSGVHIRGASYRDWKELATLYRECFPDEPEGQISAYCREYRHDTEVAVLAGEIHGAIIALPRPADGLVWLQIIAVSRRTRRSGLGKQLLQHFEQGAAARGYAKVALATRPWYHAAHGLYEGAGFTRTVEPETGDYIYSKAITPAASTRAPARKAEPRPIAKKLSKARQLFGRVAYRALVTFPETGSFSFPPPGTVSVSEPPLSSRGERMAPVVTLEQHLAQAPSAPALLSHTLEGHPELGALFEDKRLRLLLQRMPPHLVQIARMETRPGSRAVPVDQKDIPVLEAFDTLGERGLRIVLSHVQHYDHEYGALFRAYLANLAEHCDELRPAVHAAFCRIVLSAGGFTTTVHGGSGLRVISQVRGSGTLSLWPAALVSEAARETIAESPTDRPVELDTELERHGNPPPSHEMALAPGRGVMVPLYTPYRVREDEAISVVLVVAFHTGQSWRHTAAGRGGSRLSASLEAGLATAWRLVHGGGRGGSS